MAEPIQGGYILLARKMFTSELMRKPPLHMKLWVWMLDRAMWKDGKDLMRGQFVTSIAEMQDAMSYMVGYRKLTPTKDEIRSAYEAFAKATMITTAKTTRGMVITIMNYATYQTPGNYEGHSEARSEATQKPTVTPHVREEGEERKERKKTPSPAPKGEDMLFDEFWQTYPKKVGKDAARKAWEKRKVDALLSAQMVQAIERQKQTDQWQKDGGQYIPHPATWLNQARWEDEVEVVKAGRYGGGLFAGGI